MIYINYTANRPTTRKKNHMQTVSWSNFYLKSNFGCVCMCVCMYIFVCCHERSTFATNFINYNNLPKNMIWMVFFHSNSSRWSISHHCQIKWYRSVEDGKLQQINVYITWNMIDNEKKPKRKKICQTRPRVYCVHIIVCVCVCQ